MTRRLRMVTAGPLTVLATLTDEQAEALVEAWTPRCAAFGCGDPLETPEQEERGLCRRCGWCGYCDEPLDDEGKCEACERAICGACNGSGEGAYDGTTCRGCGGSGEQNLRDDDDREADRVEYLADLAERMDDY